MSWQTTYRTNADYFESYEKLRHDRRIEGPHESPKGHVCFSFTDSDLIVELVATGKLIIYWHNEKEKEKYYPLLKEVLATIDGSPVKIHPLHASVCRIPYNSPPPTLNFAWCRRGFRYVLVKEPMIVTFITVAIASIFGFITLHGLSKEALPIASNQTGLEGLALRTMVQISPYLVLAPIVILSLITILLKVRPSISDKLRRFRF